MVEVTYGRLDEVLRSLGFTVRLTKEPKAQLYEHKETGALLAFPIFKNTAKVLPRHLAATRMVLETYDSAEPTDLILQLYGNVKT